MNDAMNYQEKKRFFDQVLTIYGRKPVLEALSNPSLQHYKLHLAQSNKAGGIISQITDLAKQKQLTICYHDRLALSRISKNAQQDQGVCIDIHCPSWQAMDDFLAHYDNSKKVRLLALDNITNPQNLGMIARSACAGTIDGIIIPHKGCAKLDSLVIKASAGTLLKAPILRCASLGDALTQCREKAMDIIGLAANAPDSYFDKPELSSVVYVLGNETNGLSKEIGEKCNKKLSIPMNNQVESLNVAVTAALLAYREPF